MWPDQVLIPGPLVIESDAPPTAPCRPALPYELTSIKETGKVYHYTLKHM